MLQLRWERYVSDVEHDIMDSKKIHNDYEIFKKYDKGTESLDIILIENCGMILFYVKKNT